MELLCIATIVQEGQAPSITGSLIHTSIKVAKLELSLGSTLFQSNYHYSKNWQQIVFLYTPGNSYMTTTLC